jgi:hypothetical protein
MIATPIDIINVESDRSRWKIQCYFFCTSGAIKESLPVEYVGCPESHFKREGATSHLICWSAAFPILSICGRILRILFAFVSILWD